MSARLGGWHRTLRRVTVMAAAAVAWWVWGAPWANEPNTYHAVLVYGVLGLLGGVLHVRAVVRFDRMLRNVRKDESLGLAPAGSSIFAANQRFRYVARTIEAAVIMVISVLGFLAVSDTGIRTSPYYVRTVITYLLGSVAITGYLTLRDLRVIDAVRRATDEDAAALYPVGPDTDAFAADGGGRTLPGEEPNAPREENQ